MNIPRGREQGLIDLTSINEDLADRLRQAIKTAPQGLTHKPLVQHVLEQIKPPASAEAARIESITDTIIELYALRARLAEPSERFVGELYRAAATSKNQELREAVGDGATFQSRILSVLALGRPIEVAAKTSDLYAEHERTLCSLRIFTNVRPVFRDDPDEPPSGVLITHSLRIAYHKDGRVESLFVELAEDDLMRLRNAVERAERKQSTLTTVLQGSALPVLKLEKER